MSIRNAIVALIAMNLLCSVGNFAFASPKRDSGFDIIGEIYPEFNGKTIHLIKIQGLKRSKEELVRWLLGIHEGEAFDSTRWHNGIEKLYSTGTLFEIYSKLNVVNIGGEEQLEILLNAQDKWTLFPYLDFQSGGGSLNLEAGVFDTNVAGTFTEAAIGGAYLDSSYSYSASFFQKYVMGSDISFGANIAKIRTPIALQDRDGSKLQDFTWIRNQQGITWGRQHSETFRTKYYLDFYKDKETSIDSRAAYNVYRIQQYRFSPTLIKGKVSNSGIFEQGSEFTVTPAFANPFRDQYHIESLSAAYKRVFYLPNRHNFAFYLGGGLMSKAPLAYQFRLGGFESIRGFSANRAMGLEYLRSNWEFRSAIWGSRIKVFDIGKFILQSCAFTDFGTMLRLSRINPSDANSSVYQNGTLLMSSAGIGLRIIFLELSGASIRIDWAKTLTPKEGSNISFGVGQFF